MVSRGSDRTPNMLIYENFNQNSPQNKQRGMSDGNFNPARRRKRKSKKRSDARLQTAKMKKKKFAAKLIFYTIRNIM